MNHNTFLIVTSVSGPTSILQKLADGSRNANIKFVMIGDAKSPKDFHLNGCDFYSTERQIATGFRLAEKCPLNHYSRKNIGYLIAILEKAHCIIETDDDNVPCGSFWQERQATHSGRYLTQGGWINIYSFFTGAKIWPRGFPLEEISSPSPEWDELPIGHCYCPIQQGLSNENPDVDAIYRLILPLPQSFRTDRRLALGKMSWSPFNSQNTAWWPDAFPLMYLPSYCSFRMTDIWRSFVAQRIAWTNDWFVLFHEPNVKQERNIHSLMADFEDEVPGYINGKNICRSLENVQLKKGREFIEDNLILCYEELVSNGYIPKQELTLLTCWMHDLNNIRFSISQTQPAATYGGSSS